MQHASFTQAPFIHVFPSNTHTLRNTSGAPWVQYLTQGYFGIRWAQVVCNIMHDARVCMCDRVCLCVFVCLNVWNFMNQRWTSHFCCLTFGVPLHPGTLHLPSFCPPMTCSCAHFLQFVQACFSVWFDWYISHHSLLSKLVPIPAPAHLNQMPTGYWELQLPDNILIFGIGCFGVGKCVKT